MSIISLVFFFTAYHVHTFYLHHKAAVTDIQNDETDTQTSDDKTQEDEVTINGLDAQDMGAEVAVFPSLSSEDSGLGLSASPSEQQLPPVRDSSSPASGVCTKTEDVWRKGGSMENMSKCIQDILTSVITRCTDITYHIQYCTVHLKKKLYLSFSFFFF